MIDLEPRIGDIGERLAAGERGRVDAVIAVVPQLFGVPRNHQPSPDTAEIVDAVDDGGAPGGSQAVHSTGIATTTTGTRNRGRNM